MENATQQGAENLQPAHAGRNAALAQIAKAVDAGYQEDMNRFNEETGVIEENQAPRTEAVVETQQEEEQPERQEAQTTETPEEDVETIVVQGQQVQVKKSQLIDAGRRTLQKEATADKRLQEATEMHRQAQAYLASLKQQHQPSSDADAQTQSPSSDATNGTGDQRQATQETIRALVRQEQWLATAETAAQRFMSEFKDIAEDPLLMRLASQLEDDRIAQAKAEGIALGDPWEAYKKHAETIRTRFGKPQTEKAAVSEDRIERKRSTTTVVGAGARMQSSQPQKPPTTSEQIEKMRIARMGRAIPIAR